MKKNRKTMIIMAIAAFMFGFLLSLKSAPAQERFDMAIRNDFFAGFGGNAEALDRGMAACEKALAVDGSNAEALVWHGAGLYYKGGQASQHNDAANGQELVMKGLSEMDRAVELAPSNPGVRIPRGAVLLQSTLYMPENPMKEQLLKNSLADYEKTLELQADRFSTLGTHPRGELLFGIADAHRRLGEDAAAQKMFERISTELKGSVYQKRADIWLQTKTLTPQQATCAGCHTPGK